MKRLILSILGLIWLSGCGDGIDCKPGTRVCEDNVSRTCMYGEWIDVVCKDAAPVCDETHGCVAATSNCGNGVIELKEECDGVNLNGRSCRGTLRCNSQCHFDLSDCETESGETACETNGTRCSEDSSSIEICAEGVLARVPCGEGKRCMYLVNGGLECQ